MTKKYLLESDAAWLENLAREFPHPMKIADDMRDLASRIRQQIGTDEPSQMTANDANCLSAEKLWGLDPKLLDLPHPPPPVEPKAPLTHEEARSTICTGCGLTLYACVCATVNRPAEPTAPMSVFIAWLCSCGHATKAEHEAAQANHHG